MTEPYQPPVTEPRQRSEGKLFTVQGIVIGTLLGSLAAGVVMLYLNYRTLNRLSLAQKLAAWGTALYVALVMVATLVPNSPIFGAVFIVLQALVAYFLADRLQGAAISYHLGHDGQMHSNMKAAGVGFLTGMAMIFLLLIAGIIWTVLTGAAPANPAA